MARKEQLETLAVVATGNLERSGLELDDADRVEIAAILTWRLHKQGNAEGQAQVNAKSWPLVTRSWQGKYRALIRQVLRA